MASTKYIPDDFLCGIGANLRARGEAYGNTMPTESALLDTLRRQHSDHQAAGLIAEMNDAGVARSVLLFPDFGVALPNCPNPEIAIDEHIAICKKYPGRFHLFVGIDPRREGALARFSRYAQSGDIDGLKLYPPCGYSPSDRMLYPFYALCADLGLPVLFHSGPTSPVLDNRWADPICVDRAAMDFPEVDFIIGHGGINYTETASLLCAYRPNIYLDFSAFPCTLHPGGWCEQLAKLFRQSINHKIIFGTDWPVTRKPGGLAPLMTELLAPQGPFATISNRDRALIMGGNMNRILHRRHHAAR